jgi:transcriptional regulator with XRE-family HTH domain
VAKKPYRLEPSELVPRRARHIRGRTSPLYPELNYQVLAPRLGISAVHIGRILNGHSRPSMQTAQRLAALMGWTIDQVNGLYKPPPEKPLGRKTAKKKAKKVKKAKKSNAQSRNRRPHG